MKTEGKGKWNYGLEIIMILLGLLFLSPFYFLLANSVKSFGEILSNAAAWPSEFVWSNYSQAWKLARFSEAFRNSIIITVICVILIALFAAMAAYRMVRADSKFNRILLLLFVAAMVVPFQTIMIPILQVVNFLGVNNSIPGLVMAQLGLSIPMAIFLFHGFIKSVPMEIEEAATVDGCNPLTVFFRIVLPLLKPMLMTIIVLNALGIWNDYLLPSLILQAPELRTIPLATFSFFGQYTKQWDMALPALTLGVAPIVVFYLFMQRYIVEGIAAGSVKG
ncbi:MULTISPECIES: carbohydrate ABC transporter permease [unclassified Paenibacillus]|uniref:carbohydrate ABC transporter permease n=1 Tax=unclassified Paenibacillus TaxID=185978 RepID=UPI0024050A26|nr:MULTISPECIES: carbohydrate ABC transporter permease [unclassified Paenibacillus]MDF9845334.1 raffinose/stachyose/melibiose transport system permease protein [Paenibacillus sp. PastF-2]MDF9851916.1 raffinose/stachyose/melibiose transport system permease protein [Paenibacillus sp. PastM-2]MDF9858470.1 raffinose/stachyose/melibiose transport system permease protein [Paenibacillus sp. PastF-1]MDH6483746.1 raffinose/stachyose/melibiose transport system permease protein [Paenibacillus sp. PastH-2]